MAAARVLVVDDDEMLRKAYLRLLGRSCGVTLVESAEAALDAINEGDPFDVILIDVGLPGANGVDLYQRIAETHAELTDRVVFVTGNDSRDREPFAMADCVPTLSKPFQAAELEQLIESIAMRRG
jgi:two-component system NtrC family sensor kinase